IADAPVREIQVGVVRTGHPNRSATGLPRIARPRLATRLAWSRDRIEAPGLFTRAGIERGQEPPYAVLGARCSDDDFVFDDQRRDGERVTQLGSGNRDIPDQS